MKGFKSCLLASAGLVILAVTLSFTTPGRAIAQRVKDDCIRICDTASNPLHVIVQGITRVTGDVTINNQNAIATTVTGPVQVSKSRGEPLLVVQRRTVDSIFQEQVSMSLFSGDQVHSEEFVVPAGKFLEIKHASGMVIHKGPGFTQPFEVFVTLVQPNTNLINFRLTKEFEGYNSAYDIAHYQVGPNQVGIFCPAGSTVQVRLERRSVPLHLEVKLEMVMSGEYHDL